MGAFAGNEILPSRSHIRARAPETQPIPVMTTPFFNHSRFPLNSCPGPMPVQISSFRMHAATWVRDGSAASGSSGGTTVLQASMA